MRNGGRVIGNSLSDLGPAMARGDLDGVIVERSKLPPTMPTGILLNRAGRPYRVVNGVTKNVAYAEVWRLYDVEQSTPAPQAQTTREGQAAMSDDSNTPSDGADTSPQPDPFDRVKQLLVAHKVTALDESDRIELRQLQRKLSIEQLNLLRPFLPGWKPVCEETGKEWEPKLPGSFVRQLRSGQCLLIDVTWSRLSPEGEKIRKDWMRPSGSATQPSSTSTTPSDSAEPDPTTTPPPEPVAPAPEPAPASTDTSIPEERHAAFRRRMEQARDSFGKTSEEIRRQLDSPVLREKEVSVK